MINVVWSALLALLLLSGCGWNGTPSRANDFVPLTSIKIVAASPTIDASHTIAALTSTKLTVIGNYSGQFTRDITDQATWSSNSPTVADFITAVNKNRVTGIAPGAATLTATVVGVSATFTATFTLTVSSAVLDNMTFSPMDPSVPKGKTTQFTVSGTFSDSTTQDLTFDATWFSSDATIATVSDDPASKGLAKAEGASGTAATITARFDGYDFTTQLTVTDPVLESITVTPANSSIAGFAKTVTYTATGTYSDGTTADITSAVTWDSSQKSIATISTAGVATTVAAGTTSISATLNGINGNTDLTVTALVLKTLQITPANPTLTVGSSQQLNVTATYTDNSTLDVTTSSAWTSTFPTIATVNTTGIVVGNSVGSTTISALYAGQTVATIVTVQ
jgi:hypothetical protein